jgi:hypothetical protein
MQENILEIQFDCNTRKWPPRPVSNAIWEKEAGKTAIFFAFTPKKEQV